MESQERKDEIDYCKVDPFTEEEREFIFSQKHLINLPLQLKFLEFADKYRKHYSNRTKQIEEKDFSEKDKDDIRSSISVLVITGSIFKNNAYFENGREEKYYQNAEDLSIAFYICHLFHYVYRIPFQQLLMTSVLQEQFNDSDDFYAFNYDEFCLFQNAVLAQVGNIQYKFILENCLLERFVPFKSQILNEKLKIFENHTKLLVFILDHESSNLKYDEIVNTLNQLSCKHFYVFCDSCYSTSLIDLINVSNKFNKIFPGLSNEDSSELFQHFSNMKSINDDNQDFLAHLNDNISQTFKKESKDMLSLYLEKVDMRILIKLINYISKHLPSIKCIPKCINQFSERSTIFAESISHGNSLALPARRIYASFYKNYRSCGSIFSSIFIEAFLSKPITFDEFCQKIRDLFPIYKENFVDIIIIEQYKKTTENDQLKACDKDQLKEEKDDDDDDDNSEEIINNFFRIDPLDGDHLISNKCSSDEWPNFESIFEDKKYWNIDSSVVNPIEYENIYINQLYKTMLILPKNPNGYGPSKNKNRIRKYLHDFAKEFNMKLKATNEKEFSLPKKLINACSTSNEKILKQMKGKGFHVWTDFLTKISPYRVDNLYRGIEYLKYPIIQYVNNNDINEKSISEWLSESYKTLLPFWKNYRLNYF